MIVGTTTTSSSSSGGRHISERTHTVCAKEVTKKPVSINWQWSKKYRLHYIILLFFFRQLSFPCHQWLVLKSLEVPKWVSDTSKKRNTYYIDRRRRGKLFFWVHIDKKSRETGNCFQPARIRVFIEKKIMFEPSGYYKISIIHTRIIYLKSYCRHMY